MSIRGYADGARNSYSHELVVGDAHIDRLGHANNVVMLQWVQDVAEAHSAAVGFPLAAYEQMGAAFVVRHHAVDYLRPARRGEQLLVRTWVSDAKSVSCSRSTEIVSSDGHLVARAQTTWVFAELATLRIVPIPNDVRLAFGFEQRGRGSNGARAGHADGQSS